MKRNPWLKLAAVSIVGIVMSFTIIWGIGQFNTYNYYNGYQMQGRVNMQNNRYRYYNPGQSGMNMQNGMGTMNGMNVQGSMNMQGNMNGGMSMQGNMGMMGGM